MQHITLPVAEVVSYLREHVRDFPAGHGLPRNPREAETIVVDAAAIFVMSYIQERLVYVRRKPDAMANMLGTLGYNLKDWSVLEVDEFCNELDDYFLDLTIIADMVVEPLLKMIGSRHVSIHHLSGQDYLSLDIGEDMRIERYRRLLANQRTLRMPTKIREIDDLAGIEDYLDKTISDVFNRIDIPVVKDEVKRILSEIVTRQ